MRPGIPLSRTDPESGSVPAAVSQQRAVGRI
jgi:hypothetical protein